MEIIGLTGNIGSGKSTVGKILAEFGAVVIDCDAVSRQLVAPGRHCLGQIMAIWGENYLLADGSLDRKKMAANIFSHPSEKEKLEQILHPAIKEEVQRQIAINRAKGATCVVVEAPLLIEAGFIDFVDTVWLVLCSREKALARLTDCRGYSLPQAEATLDSQMPDIEKISYADVIIENNGSLTALKEKVAEVWRSCKLENRSKGAGKMKELKKELNTMQAVAEFQPAADRLFYSANHDEILAGATTDIYFVKTLEILSHLGRENAQVKAEIFARRDGIFAGIGEVKNLLQGKPGIELWALPEGAEFHYKEVVATISGPYSSFGLMETVILGMLASSCGWATAAKEIKAAAGDYPITCFGARHVHPAVAPVMERAALVGGADGASCILGAKLMGREPQGTAPHALMLIVGDTVEAALAYHKVMPDGALRLVLVDTFKDEGEESLRVAAALGDSLDGIRLDTPGERGGVTTELVKELRARLDMAGYEKVKIFVSGGLTPERVAILKEAGVDSFGVGSYISGASAIDMTMDIKEVDGKPVAKRGRIPGIRSNDRLEKLL